MQAEIKVWLKDIEDDVIWLIAIKYLPVLYEEIKDVIRKNH